MRLKMRERVVLGDSARKMNGQMPGYPRRFRFPAGGVLQGPCLQSIRLRSVLGKRPGLW